MGSRPGCEHSHGACEARSKHSHGVSIRTERANGSAGMRGAQMNFDFEPEKRPAGALASKGTGLVQETPPWWVRIPKSQNEGDQGRPSGKTLTAC